MKKLIFAILFFAVTFGASAEFRWGPTLGMNISGLKWKQSLVSTGAKVGPNIGVMGELMIPGIGFGIDMGLKYAKHGADVNFGDQTIWEIDNYGKETLWFHTLQIPLNLRFKWTRMNGAEHYAAPFVYGGPVFTFNLQGSKLPIVEYPTGSAGLQCGIGGEFYERFQLSVGYLWGLSYDVRTLKLDNFSAAQRGWQLNACVLF